MKLLSRNDVSSIHFRGLYMLCVLCAAVLAIPGAAFCANHYIRSGASGSNNGSDWNNAWTGLPSSFVRGDTYYIAGGSYGSHTFSTATSGATYIYIKRATEDDHGTNTGWNNTYDNTQTVFTGTLTVLTGYWDFDGVTGGGPDEWATGHGIAVRNSTAAHLLYFNASGISNVIVKNVEFDGLATAGGPNRDIVYGQKGGTDITFQYCYFHDTACDLFQLGGNWPDLLIEYCFFDDGYIATASDCHTDVIEYGVSTGTGSNWTIRYNKFEDMVGTYAFGSHKTSTLSGAKIYGNIFTDSGFSNGLVSGLTTGGVITGLRFYNNTIIDSGYGPRSNIGIVNFNGGTDNRVYNNIWYNFAVAPSFATSTHDYNAFSGSNAFGESNAQTGITTGIFTDYAGGDFTLLSATSGGKSDLGSPYNIDAFGQIRGSDGVWDRGAYEYGGAGGGNPAPTTTTALPDQPSPPTGLKIIEQQ